MDTLPENRTPQEWVNFYLQVESDVASGKSRTLNGRKIEYDDLSEIRKARADWESRLLSSKATSQRIGGLRYKTADMSL